MLYINKNSTLLFLILTLLLVQLPIIENAKEGRSYSANKSTAKFALLELFTSEGCSSCPPADKLMNELEKEADKNGTEIYILNLHVNYWDYLGWKDSYAKPKFTDRQDYYARFFPAGQSYTPQLVINGKYDLIGSEELLIKKQIGLELNIKREKIIKSVRAQRVDTSAVIINYELLQLPPNTDLYFALIENKIPESIVKLGENRGKKLSHYSVVRALEKVEPKKLIEKFELKYPLKQATKNFSIIAFLQHQEKRTIVAVTKSALN